MKGLIVKEPFASWIVEGKKEWEIRKSSTKIRGEVYIINRGFAIGKAELVDVLGPFTPEELKDYKEKHMAEYDFLKEYSNGKKLYAWVFKNPVKFEKPLEVIMPKGAQIWVNIRGFKE
ncbi:ASCH domain-containing protein [Thermococcus aggregans]|uniref:ASCH domain-containing protein n=1 Tax=Thermococcus aggregans TaxID=110163 RepID=A0A9E7MVZ8_THEAG|nr:ASCH domain-containing protein [Thermococcus aggregans]USS39948.1 ASCH domain-containing protein [Thermococcus aggregans]